MKTSRPHVISESSARRRPAKSAAPLAIKRILVPVDFSEAGKPALHYASSLARLTGASVCLAHVMEHIYSGGRVYAGPQIDYVQLDAAAMRERITRELGAIQATIFSDIPTTFEIREGSAFHEIVGIATAVKADLVVMATHGYTGLQHIVMGSTTERVVRHAACPVLVVRSQSPAAAPPPKNPRRRPARAAKSRRPS
jgi:nucleotide-binding universal stress UspA family protein